MMPGSQYGLSVAAFWLWAGCAPLPEESHSSKTTLASTTATPMAAPGTAVPDGPGPTPSDLSTTTPTGTMKEGLVPPSTPSSAVQRPSPHGHFNGILRVETLAAQHGPAEHVAAADLNADGHDELVRFHSGKVHWQDREWELTGAIQALVRIPSSSGPGEALLIGTGMGKGHPEAETRVWRLTKSGLKQLYKADTGRNQITDLQWVDGRILLTHFLANKLVSSRFLDTPDKVVHQGPMAMQQKMEGQRLVVGRIYGDAPKSHGDLTVYGATGDPQKLNSLRGVRRTHIADINGDGHPDLLTSDGWHYRYGEQGDARLVVYPGPLWSEPRVLTWLQNDYTIRDIKPLTIQGVQGVLLTGSSGLYWAAPAELGWQAHKVATINETDNAAVLHAANGVTLAVSGSDVQQFRIILPHTDPSPPPPTASEKAPRNALLLVIDTLRADAIEQAQTPQLDAVEALGFRVPVAWSSGTWTVPSVVSLLTGASVPEHGWNEPSGRMGKYPPLPSLRRLPEVLQDSGFKTSGFYANPYLNEDLGFSKGFTTWKHVSDRTVAKQFAKHVQTEWSDEGRHFSYVHILGPHSPVDPSEHAQERWGLTSEFLDAKGQIGIGRAKRNQEEGIREAYRKGYLGTVEDTDEIVGQILEALGHHRDQTVIVITSDHGELLGEHNIVGHGTWTWRELVEVPLYFDSPGTGESLPNTLGIHAIPDLMTRTLGIHAQWPQSVSPAQLLISQREDHLTWSIDGLNKAILTPKGAFLYDLLSDPREENPLPISNEAMSQLTAWQASHPSLSVTGEATVQLPEDTLKALEALGYVE